MDTCLLCSSNKVASNNSTGLLKKRFSKKLLVAISLLVLVSMCLMPAEGKPVEHRKRHQRMSRLNPDTYKNMVNKIIKILKNAKRFFEEDLKQIEDSKFFRDGNPRWLPKVNFVHIHQHRNSGSTNETLIKRRFKNFLPKFYKSLTEYEALFKKLQTVEIDIPDMQLRNYTIFRNKMLPKLIEKLSAVITQASDSMVAIKLPISEFNKKSHQKKFHLETLATKVDAVHCLKNDNIAFRGYGNLLKHWLIEFRCIGSRKTDKPICHGYENKLVDKKKNKGLMNVAV